VHITKNIDIFGIASTYMDIAVGSVVAVAFQSVFHAEIHQNDVFSF